jgi:hypothetical protein
VKSPAGKAKEKTWQMQSFTQNNVNAKNALAFPVRWTDWLGICAVQVLFCHDLKRQGNALFLKASNIKNVSSPAHGKTHAVPPPLANNQKGLVTVHHDS